MTFKPLIKSYENFKIFRNLYIFKHRYIYVENEEWIV